MLMCFRCTANCFPSGGLWVILLTNSNKDGIQHVEFRVCVVNSSTTATTTFSSIPVKLT